MTSEERIRRRHRQGKLKWHSIAKINRFFSSGKCKVNFPAELDLFDHTDIFCKLFHKIAFAEKELLEIHLGKVEFIYPEAVVYLAAIAEHILRRSNVEIREFQPKNVETDEYLRICGLRDFFYVPIKELPTREPSFFGDCIPISRDPQDKDSVAQKMTDLLNVRLKLDADTKALLSQGIGEVMGNSVEHGEVVNWYRIAQVHQKRKWITLAIADNGVGVCHTLRSGFKGQKYDDMKDAQLLKESFKDHVTRYAPKEGEAHGYGLTNIKKFVEKTHSKLAIVSGEGVYKVDYSTGGMIESFSNTKQALPGTLIVVRIPFKE